MSNPILVGVLQDLRNVAAEVLEIEVTVGVGKRSSHHIVCVGFSELSWPASSASILLRAEPESFSLN
jgi:hypothetical protein